MKKTLFVFWLGCLIAMGRPCLGASLPASERVYVSFTKIGFPIVSTIAQIDSAPVLCALDTGAGHTLLPDTGSFSGLTKTGTWTSHGFTCEPYEVDLVAPRIDYGGIGIPAAAAVRSRAYSRAMLGNQVFAGRRAEFLFSKGRIIFDGKAPKEVPQPFRVSSQGHPIIRAKVAGTTVEALWDSGAQVTLVDQAFYEAHPGAFRELGAMALDDSVGNSRTMRMFECSEMAFGDVVLTKRLVAVADLSCASKVDPGLKVDLLVGSSTLLNADWYFDFVENTWSVRSDDVNWLNNWKKNKNSAALPAKQSGTIVDPFGVLGGLRTSVDAAVKTFADESGADIRFISVPSVENWDVNDFAAGLVKAWGEAKAGARVALYVVYVLDRGEFGIRVQDETAQRGFGGRFTPESVRQIFGDAMQGNAPDRLGNSVLQVFDSLRRAGQKELQPRR